ncbi:anti-phage ZorAB system protein ZorA [Fulvimarina sp. MAC3]|uniref:anti-phage ZorAB system protein ZorA n=1 Tax=Fulvimarina sp. MAC3 TaxID=3148887 RepID=UPI0031FD2B03
MFELFNPWFSFGDLTLAVQDSLSGSVEALSRPTFVFALAWAIVAAGLGFAACYFVLYVVWISFSLHSLRKTVEVLSKSATKGRGIDRKIFAKNYDAVRERFRNNGLIGHAFHEFDETLVVDEDRTDLVCNTVRPQAFINPGVAKETFGGLKFMNALPGYFVGIGLLLTFVGLVLALSKAGAAAAAQDVDDMQRAVGELLQIATFKFATSIAGLGMSILLAILFRAYTIAIEASFHRLCRTLEQALLYKAPQSISIEMNRTMKEQRDELKQITQGDFFARMGEEIAPKFDKSINDALSVLGGRIDTAMSGALGPVTQSLDRAIVEMKNQNETGVGELIKEFSQSVQSSAGTEMRELAETLSKMQEGLAEMQAGLRGTGEDFGRRMADAADNLTKMVGEAGANLGRSSEQSKEAFDQIANTLRETMETANAQIGQALGSAAGGASAQLEETMGRVLEKLETQIGRLATEMGRFQSDMRSQIETTQEELVRSQREAAERSSRMSEEFSEVLRSGASRTSEQFGTKISEAADNLNQMVARAGETFGASSQQSSAALAEIAETLRQTMERANTQVDQALGSAATGASVRLEEAMGRVLERLEGQVGGFSEDVGRYQSGIRSELEQTSAHVASAQRQASDAMLALSNELTQTLRAGMTDVMQSVSGEFERLTGTIRSLETSLQSQSTAITATTSETRKTADVFHETAASVRSASAPLIQVGERFGMATETLGTRMEETLSAIRLAQGASEAMARSLGEAHEESRGFWQNYAESFRGIDTELGRAVDALSTATTNHQQVLDRHVRDTDDGLGNAVGKLSGLLETLNDSAESFSESADKLSRNMRQIAAE